MEPVILLVEDEEPLLVAMRDFVTMKLPGYSTVGARSAEHAEKEIAAFGPRRLSLVCVDHVLEGRRGLDFLQSVRSRFPTVPVILFTGRANEREADQARSVGIHVLWKPITMSAWLAEMRTLLGASASGASAR